MQSWGFSLLDICVLNLNWWENNAVCKQRIVPSIHFTYISALCGMLAGADKDHPLAAGISNNRPKLNYLHIFIALNNFIWGGRGCHNSTFFSIEHIYDVKEQCVLCKDIRHDNFIYIVSVHNTCSISISFVNKIDFCQNKN